MSFYRNQLEQYLSELEIRCNRVLDCGGSANPVNKRVKFWDVKDYKILDNNNEKGWHDKWNEPDYIIDLEDIWENHDSENGYENDLVDKFRGERFNYIFCLEVFEYLSDFDPLLNAFHELLIKDKKYEGGILYISICEKYPVHNPIESDSSRLTKKGFEKLIKHQFKILECIPRNYSPEAFAHIQEAWRIDGLRAAKHFKGHEAIGHIWKLKKI